MRRKIAAVGHAGTPLVAPNHDIFGTTRPQGAGFDIGAFEVAGVSAAIGSITGGPLTFNNVVIGTTSATKTLTLHNTGNADLTGITVTPSAQFVRVGGSCGTTLTAATATCTITMAFQPTGTVGATVAGNRYDHGERRDNRLACNPDGN